jgi:hypothetical protein
MKFTIKIIGVLVMITLFSSFSEISEIGQKSPYSVQNDLFLMNENFKYELAIENLRLLNDHDLSQYNIKQENKELNTVTSTPILTKRKSKSYNKVYNGSFYKGYELN